MPTFASLWRSDVAEYFPTGIDVTVRVGTSIDIYGRTELHHPLCGSGHGGPVHDLTVGSLASYRRCRRCEEVPMVRSDPDGVLQQSAALREARRLQWVAADSTVRFEDRLGPVAAVIAGLRDEVPTLVSPRASRATTGTLRSLASTIAKVDDGFWERLDDVGRLLAASTTVACTAALRSATPTWDGSGARWLAGDLRRFVGATLRTPTAEDLAAATRLELYSLAAVYESGEAETLDALYAEHSARLDDTPTLVAGLWCDPDEPAGLCGTLLAYRHGTAASRLRDGAHLQVIPAWVADAADAPTRCPVGELTDEIVVATGALYDGGLDLADAYAVAQRLEPSAAPRDAA